MHEVGIVLQLLEAVQATARSYGQNRVLDVYVKVGQLRAIEPEVMDFCWQTTSKKTIAEGAILHIETIFAKGYCEDCNTIFDAQDLIFVCEQCGGHRVKTEQGHELLLDRVVMSDHKVEPCLISE